MADVVPFPTPPGAGGRDVVVSACWCGCTRWRAVVELAAGVVVDVEPLVVCADCAEAYALR
jgi:hypothetical protein